MHGSSHVFGILENFGETSGLKADLSLASTLGALMMLIRDRYYKRQDAQKVKW